MGLWVRVPISLLHFVNMHFKVWAKTRTYLNDNIVLACSFSFCVAMRPWYPAVVFDENDPEVPVDILTGSTSKERHIVRLFNSTETWQV